MRDEMPLVPALAEHGAGRTDPAPQASIIPGTQTRLRDADGAHEPRIRHIIRFDGTGGLERGVIVVDVIEGAMSENHDVRLSRRHPEVSLLPDVRQLTA